MILKSINNLILESNIITFPKHEWDIYQDHLRNNQEISTLRIFKEFKKYKVGQIYNTEWGYGQFKVIKSEIFNDLDQILQRYPYYNNTMTNQQKLEVRKYSNGKIERLTLLSV